MKRVLRLPKFVPADTKSVVLDVYMNDTTIGTRLEILHISGLARRAITIYNIYKQPAQVATARILAEPRANRFLVVNLSDSSQWKHVSFSLAGWMS